ncbi:MAG: NAD(P)/FAD-dependent oxidoreductase, partial [Zhenhengia sp.]
MYDMIIVGGGPSGLTAALYAGRAELKALMIEKAFHGGQMVTTNEVENYPGIMETTGPELAGIMYEQATRFGTEVKFEEVIKIEDEGDIKKDVTASNMNEAKTVLLSMGAKPRKLG